MKVRPLVASNAQPSATVAFQWAMGAAAIVLSAGGVLDNWAHFHGLVDHSFFTPWHAVMYGMMATLGIVLGSLALANVRKGYRPNQSLPPGYLLSLTGVFVFIVAGLLDLGWHLMFGIEQATEAFVSPTHIFLCVGGLLAGTGPLRAAYLTLAPATTRGWRSLGPMLLSAMGALIALGIFTQIVSPMNDLFAAKDAANTSGTFLLNSQSFGIAEMIIQTMLLMGMVLLLVRTWALPFGAMTLLVGLPSLTQLLMRDHYWLILGVVGTGLVADLVLLRLSPPLEVTRLYYLAALVPTIYGASMFVVLMLTDGLQWSANMVLGSLLYTSATGLFLAFLLDWPVKLRLRNSEQADPGDKSATNFRRLRVFSEFCGLRATVESKH